MIIIVLVHTVSPCRNCVCRLEDARHTAMCVEARLSYIVRLVLQGWMGTKLYVPFGRNEWVKSTTFHMGELLWLVAFLQKKSHFGLQIDHKSATGVTGTQWNKHCSETEQLNPSIIAEGKSTINNCIYDERPHHCPHFFRWRTVSARSAWVRVLSHPTSPGKNYY